MDDEHATGSLDLTDLTVLEAALATLAEVYNKKMTVLLLRAYDLALRDMPDAAIARGCDWLLANHDSSFMPTPAEFVRACRAVLTPDEAALVDGVRLWRSWLLSGMVPHNLTPEQWIAVTAALGLPRPPDNQLADVRASRAALAAWCQDHPELVGPIPDARTLPPSPIVAHLLARAQQRQTKHIVAGVGQ